MNSDLNRQLIQDYTDLFYKDFVVDCGDGWYTILKSLCESIHEHIIYGRKHHAVITEYNRMVKAVGRGDFSLFEEYYSCLTPERLDQQRKYVVNYTPVQLPNTVEDFCFEEIKEKYGKLIIIYRGGDAEIAAMIRLATTMSKYTCKVSGQPSLTHQCEPT